MSGGCDYLAERASAAQRGGASASVYTRLPRVPGVDAGFAEDFRLDGIVDFDRDRCRFVTGDSVLVCDGATTYHALDDGRWVRQTDSAGRWCQFHPTWFLELLRRTCDAAESRGPGRWYCRFAPDALAAITASGLAADWTRITAEVALDAAERITGVAITLIAPGSGEPDASLEFALDLAEFTTTPNVIAVPDPDDIIDHAAYIAEKIRSEQDRGAH